MRIISRQLSYFLQFVQIFRLFLTAEMLFWLVWTLPPSMKATSSKRTLFFLWTQRRWQVSPFPVSLINVEWFPLHLRTTSGAEPRSGTGDYLTRALTAWQTDPYSQGTKRPPLPKEKLTLYLCFKNWLLYTNPKVKITTWHLGCADFQISRNIDFK